MSTKYLEILDKIKTISPSSTLVAVSKTHSYERVLDSYRDGARIFGENRLQEIEEKFPLPHLRPDGMKVFFIGHLQKNKVKKAVLLSDRIESIDSLELLEKVNKEAEKINKRIDILLEYNSSKEVKKSGFQDKNELIKVAKIAKEMKNVNLLGVMTIGPITDEKEKIRKAFQETKMLFDLLEIDNGVISMGMSGDYVLALEEGSNEVRIGSAIFGERV